MKRFMKLSCVVVAIVVLLPVVWAQDETREKSVGERPDDARQPGNKPENVKLPPPRFTFKCVKYYNTFSTPPLPTNNAMMSFMDKDKNLYIALRAEKTVEGAEAKAGGLFVQTAGGKTYIYNKKSSPPIPSNSVEHALKDDNGLIYVSTGDAGLAVIDTKSTPEDQSDDTVRVYTMMGVTDVTKKLDAKPFSHSPSIGCDHVISTWMNPKTGDLLVCCGSETTYKGGLTVLIYDGEKGDYTKSYTYRALNYRVGQTQRKFYEPAVFDTTQCFQPDRKYLPLTGGKVLKRFRPSRAFGENHFCYRAFQDNSTGFIYVARRDTWNANLKEGTNGDGGLTIIDTKKTVDPSDDEVRVLDTSSVPALAGPDVYHVRLDTETGKLSVSTGDMMGVHGDRMYGLTIIDKSDKAETYRSNGKFDTTKDRTGELIDEKSALHSGFVLGTLKNEKTGDVFVLQKDAIDIIHKDGFVSRIPCEIFKGLPGKPPTGIIWALSGRLDNKGRLCLCTGEIGGLGLLVLEMTEYAGPE